MIAFGPVPSRRLGNSLGINNIFAKHCPYACIYCQVGRTNWLSPKRRSFLEPGAIVKSVECKLGNFNKTGEPVDYITIVADGEPTLDLKLAQLIEALQIFGIKLAVISNSSLLWQKAVRNDLMKADLVSVKVDAVTKRSWRRINRPDSSLDLSTILQGIQAFSDGFQGELITETMLINGINDSPDQASALGEFLMGLGASRSYLAVPTRPTAEKWARPPEPEVLNNFYQTLSQSVDNLEYLIGYEGNSFSSTGDVREDLLSITAVHPMREDAVAAVLKKSGADFTEVRKLITAGLLNQVEYQGHRYYVREYSVS
jgi:wyosine [tRNA(Phe)-imidazoG37] synthetase (radical SAM superfamily)